MVTMKEPRFYGDYALLTFPLRGPYDLERVMGIFENDMELIMLYHHMPVGLEKSGHSTCAYSNPASGQVSKMNVRIDTDGKVNRITATIYDSLELVYGNLCLGLKLHTGNGSFKYKENQGDVLLDFI